MQTITYEERQLMSIYNVGNRSGTISAIKDMREYLDQDETELTNLSDSALQKLEAMSDTDFEELGLTPDFIDAGE